MTRFRCEEVGSLVGRLVGSKLGFSSVGNRTRIRFDVSKIAETEIQGDFTVGAGEGCAARQGSWIVKGVALIPR